MRARTLLHRLEKLKPVYGPDVASRKMELLTTLARRRLSRAEDVERLHETLCFLHAYPDDRRVRRQVETMLKAFDRRGDLRTFREELVDTGIAGTDLYFRFFYFSALWLAERCPESIRVDWNDFDNEKRLEDAERGLSDASEFRSLVKAA